MMSYQSSNYLRIGPHPVVNKHFCLMLHCHVWCSNYLSTMVASMCMYVCVLNVHFRSSVGGVVWLYEREYHWRKRRKKAKKGKALQRNENNDDVIEKNLFLSVCAWLQSLINPLLCVSILSTCFKETILLMFQFYLIFSWLYYKWMRNVTFFSVFVIWSTV